MPLTIWLLKGEKARREKFPIVLNNVINFYHQSRSELQHIENLVSIQIQTAHFGIGANAKQAKRSFGKKTAQKLDHIKNSPLAVITTLLTIYRELTPPMIDMGPINPWELLKTLCTGTAVAEFNDTLFKAI